MDAEQGWCQPWGCVESWTDAFLLVYMEAMGMCRAWVLRAAVRMSEDQALD